MYFLNEEVYSNIEFEIIFVPEKIASAKVGELELTDINSCFFKNDVYFSTNLAKYVFNINEISLTFKVFNSFN